MIKLQLNIVDSYDRGINGELSRTKRSICIGPLGKDITNFAGALLVVLCTNSLKLPVRFVMSSLMKHLLSCLLLGKLYVELKKSGKERIIGK